MPNQIAKDIGQKCADDIRGALLRNALLLDTTEDRMMVAIYGAAAALGAASGAYAAHRGLKSPTPTPELLDELWAVLRPLTLGQRI